MAQQSEFLNKQQALAYHVARLPMLRQEVEDAKMKCSQPLFDHAQFEYRRCVRDIKQLAAAL